MLPQTLWMADFLAEAVRLRLTGMTCYMYDGKFPLFTRFLSFFHFWLPLLLLWLVLAARVRSPCLALVHRGELRAAARVLLLHAAAAGPGG